MSKGRDKKPHIGIFGRRNYGKSSLINLLANQDVAIVSAVAGTTTDVVKKSIEISGIGPSVLVDTAGIDDVGELGEKRVAKTLEALKIVDLAILLIAENKFDGHEENLISQFIDFGTPFIILHNKSDIEPASEQLKQQVEKKYNTVILDFCTKQTSEQNNALLFDAMRRVMPHSAWQSQSLVGDLLKYGDTVLLITPIDIEAPEGRLILPQVMAIRDILDNDCVAVVIKEREVDTYLARMNPKPALVITDSQVFLKADASVPKDIPLTSFSIMLARHKGDFANYLKGTPRIADLRDGDRVLILESCTHHVSCDDIGRTKIPRWISNFTGKKLEYETVAGLDKIPRPITEYALVIQCGGCMITRKQIINRLKPAIDAGIPVTNYGMAIAWVHGMYQRAVAPFVKLDTKSEDYL
jgi:[FeFe] hydrogenase H-cluster maturation GTPase HydF